MTVASDRLAEPTPPRRRSRAVTAAAAATLVLVFGVAGGIAVARTRTNSPAAPVDAAAASTPATVPPTGCSTAEVDVTPGAPAPLRQPTGTTVVQFPNDAEPASSHLRAMAEQVRSAPADSSVCGRYVHLHLRQWAADTTVGSDGLGTTKVIQFDYKRWRADDGSGRVMTTRFTATSTATATVEDFPAGGLPGAVREPLSADPLVVAQQMNDIQPPAMGEQAVLRATADIYGWHTPDRDQRAAILAVLQDRNLRWRGQAIDRAGRPGIAVSVDSNSGRVRDLLILDPATGRPLAYELVFLRNPGRLTGPFPNVQDYMLYLDQHRRPDLT